MVALERDRHVVEEFAPLPRGLFNLGESGFEWGRAVVEFVHVAGADFFGPVDGGLHEGFGLYPFVSDLGDAGFVFVASVLREEPVA